MHTQIPRRQKAVWIVNPGPEAEVVVKDDVPVPTPGTFQVLVKVEVSGIWYVDHVLIPHGT